MHQDTGPTFGSDFDAPKKALVEREERERQNSGRSKRNRPRAHNPIERCAACSRGVKNRNLGGFFGRSAITGPLLCVTCADQPPQPLLLVEVW
jgi:hypothetical protein